MVEGHLSYYGYMTEPEDDGAPKEPEEPKEEPKEQRPRFLQRKPRTGCRTCF